MSDSKLTDRAQLKVEEKLASVTGSETSILQVSDEPNRGDISAATLGRMMGLATSGELKLLEGKIDLLSSKVNALTVRMEKVMSVISNAPSGADLERIDVQIGHLRTMIRETLERAGMQVPPAAADAEDDRAQKTPGSNIVASEPGEPKS